MTLKKDKQKVLGEVFDDARIKTFLQFQPPEGVNADYHLLEKAYRGMVAENFDTFLTFFKEAGHDINARNDEGQTFLQVISSHRLAEEYIEAMKKQGGE